MATHLKNNGTAKAKTFTKASRQPLVIESQIMHGLGNKSSGTDRGSQSTKGRYPVQTTKKAVL